MESIKYKKIKNCSVIDPKVSIIIRCKNEGKNIEECLNMLYKQKIGLKKEIIVIDSGSNDNTVELTIKHDVKISYHKLIIFEYKKPILLEEYHFR